jgi:hypothetical protein
LTPDEAQLTEGPPIDQIKAHGPFIVWTLPELLKADLGRQNGNSFSGSQNLTKIKLWKAIGGD